MPEILVKVDGEEVWIEAATPKGSERTTSATERVEEAFNRARSAITTVSTSIVRSYEEVSEALRPQEFTVEFSVKFTTQGKVVIASAGAEAAIKVIAKYVLGQPKPPIPTETKSAQQPT